MDNDLISPIQKLLPGALSKWILGLSITISGCLLMLPSYDLPAKYLTDIDIIKLLLRLLSAGMPLLIGTVSLIVLLVLHNRKLSSAISLSDTKITYMQHEISTLAETANTYKLVAAQSISVNKQILDSLEKLPKTA